MTISVRPENYEILNYVQDTNLANCQKMPLVSLLCRFCFYSLSTPTFPGKKEKERAEVTVRTALTDEKASREKVKTGLSGNYDLL